MRCDDCRYYHWYYDWCDKWQCEVDARSIHNCFESYETPIRDAMVGMNVMKQKDTLNVSLCESCIDRWNCKYSTVYRDFMWSQNYTVRKIVKCTNYTKGEPKNITFLEMQT